MIRNKLDSKLLNMGVSGAKNVTRLFKEEDDIEVTTASATGRRRRQSNNLRRVSHFSEDQDTAIVKINTNNFIIVSTQVHVRSKLGTSSTLVVDHSDASAHEVVNGTARSVPVVGRVVNEQLRLVGLNESFFATTFTLVEEVLTIVFSGTVGIIGVSLQEETSSINDPSTVDPRVREISNLDSLLSVTSNLDGSFELDAI